MLQYNGVWSHNLSLFKRIQSRFTFGAPANMEEKENYWSKCKYSNMQIFKYANIEISNLQMCKCSNKEGKLIGAFRCSALSGCHRENWKLGVSLQKCFQQSNVGKVLKKQILGKPEAWCLPAKNQVLSIGS